MSDERGKTLTDLEGQDWGPPNYQSYPVETIHRLRHKPIDDFSIEDLRITIGQQVGTRWLVPIAIERLMNDPLCEGDFYPGDLLNAVLKVDESYWKRHPNAREKVSLVVDRALKRLEELRDDSRVTREALDEGLARFERLFD